MSRGGPVRVGLAAVVVLLVLLAASAPGSGAPGSTATVPAVSQISPDTVLLDVTLHGNGTATWAIHYRVRLDDDNTTAAFDSLAADVRNNSTAYTGRFRERIGGTVSAAENATGRPMAVRNVSVGTSRQQIPQQYGVLTYSFEWTNFSVTDGSEIRAGDAIGGLFLDDSTSLTIHWPAGYTVTSTDPSPTESGDRSATWRGPADFTTDQPRLVVSSAASATTGSNGSGGAGGFPTTTVAAVALLAVAVVAGVWWFWARRGEVGTGAPAEPAGTEPPDELLSNEERVLRLVRAHGGRMKQQQVVQELGWTDAKTSQVVSELREAGELEAFRLGRENVLDLPDHDDASES